MSTERELIPRVQIGDERRETVDGDETLTRGEVLRRGAGVGAALALGGGLTLDAFAKTKPKPKRGGTLRLASDGTPTGHNFDPVGGLQGGEVNVVTREMFYERLMSLDRNGKVIPWLATDMSPNRDASIWKIKLRKGVTWHDGTPLTADDVVWTFRYIYNTPTTSNSAAVRVLLNSPDDIRKIDAGTVQVNLAKPNVLLPQIMTGIRYFIAKNGQSNPFFPPIGTGPFMYKGWTQGENVRSVRNPHYWISGQPYIDEFELLLISDATARLNALQSGQIDAISQLSPAHIGTVKGNASLRLLVHGGGAFTTQAMAVDMAPFTDNRVRQAFRLLVDRRQMNNVALGGIGNRANDVQNALDPDRALLKEIPQRPADPEKAKSLLAAAGASNLTVTLTACSTVGAFSPQTATVYAQQAKAAGVNVNLDFVPSDVFESTRRLKAPFCTYFWGGRFLDEYISNAMIPGGVNNETHWNNPGFTTLWEQYRGTIDKSKRHDLAIQLQRSLWNDGGYIIHNFEDLIDAHSAKLKGIHSGIVRNFDLYNFRTAYFG